MDAEIFYSFFQDLNQLSYWESSPKLSKHLDEISNEFTNKTLDWEYQDKDGNTPLHYAFKYQNENIIFKLLSGGVNPYIKNNNQKTAFDLCRSQGFLDNFNLNLQKQLFGEFNRAEYYLLDNINKELLEYHTQDGIKLLNTHYIDSFITKCQERNISISPILIGKIIQSQYEIPATLAAISNKIEFNDDEKKELLSIITENLKSQIYNFYLTEDEWETDNKFRYAIKNNMSEVYIILKYMDGLIRDLLLNQTELTNLKTNPIKPLLQLLDNYIKIFNSHRDDFTEIRKTEEIFKKVMKCLLNNTNLDDDMGMNLVTKKTKSYSQYIEAKPELSKYIINLLIDKPSVDKKSIKL